MGIEEFLSRLIGLAFAGAIVGFVIFAARGGEMAAKQAFAYGFLVAIGVLVALMVLGSVWNWLTR